MGWSAHHKMASRQTIVLAAAELFATYGYDAVAIDQVMSHAGKTRGAFYAHFESKSDLYAQAMLMAGQRLVAHSREHALNFADFVRIYLAPGQQGILTLGPLGSAPLKCPLACLVTDMAMREERLKKVYEQLFAGFVGHLQRLNPQLTQARAEACASSLIGAQVVSRAVASQELAKTILVSAQKSILEQFADDKNKA
ncbi:MAG: TetR/AcrR family transcriptional regulator [Marinagarivorans sp.]